MISALLMTLLVGVPEVVIADEHRKGGDPTEIKISVTNKTDELISITFDRNWHRYHLQFHFFDDQGQPLKLARTKRPDVMHGERGGGLIKPGKTVSGYLSPKFDYVIPPGPYQVSVTFIYQMPGNGEAQKVESNRITKTFPKPKVSAPEEDPAPSPEEPGDHLRIITTPRAGLPEVMISDEHRDGRDPTEIKITLTNKTDFNLAISFVSGMHLFHFKFHLYDEQGRPVVRLPSAINLEPSPETNVRMQIKPGETVTGYLSPNAEYEIPAGRYQVSVVYFVGAEIRRYGDAIESNRITKTFP
jgi:hypothetical protein